MKELIFYRAFFLTQINEAVQRWKLNCDFQQARQQYVQTFIITPPGIEIVFLFLKF